MSKEVKKLVDQAKRAFADKQLDLAEKICQVCFLNYINSFQADQNSYFFLFTFNRKF